MYTPAHQQETPPGYIGGSAPRMCPAELARYRVWRACGYEAWCARSLAVQNAELPAAQAGPLWAASARMADPYWRSCNTDQYCNTPPPTLGAGLVRSTRV